MKITVEEMEPCKKQFIVEIPKEEVDKEFKEIYDEIQKKTILPGFRPGKAPISLLRIRFKEYVKGEVLDKLMPRAFEKAVEEAGITPIGKPQIPEINLEEDKPFKLTFVVEFEPDFELKEYKGIEIEKKEYKVSYDEIEDALEKLRTQRVKFKDKKDQPAEKGDLVIFDYEAFVDGKPLDEKKVEGIGIVLGEGESLKGLEEGILGHKAGEEFETEVIFPEDYYDKKVAGKKALLKISLKGVKTKELPNLDDDFAREVGSENMDDLRKKIEEELRKEHDTRAKAEMVEEIKRKITSDYDFPLPPSLLDSEFKKRIDDFKFQLRLQGVDPEKADIDWGKKEEELKKDVIRDLRFSFILKKIAEREGIEIDQRELEEEVEKMAEKFGKSIEEVTQLMEKSGRLQSLAVDMLKAKVVDFLLENAKFTSDQSSKEAKNGT